MYEPPSLTLEHGAGGRAVIDFDGAKGGNGLSAQRPSVGVAGFSDSLYGNDDGGLYKSLKRTKQQQVVSTVVLGLLLVLVSVLYYTKDGGSVVSLPEGALQELSEFNNHTDLINLDLDARNNHGVCMPRADQAYLLFMNGILVAQGSDNCGLEMVDKQLRAPECKQNMHGQEMWVAIEAQDSEALETLGSGVGGIKASMEWCGLEITTNGNWRCSTTAQPGWQNPRPPPSDEEVCSGTATDPNLTCDRDISTDGTAEYALSPPSSPSQCAV